MEKEKTYHTNEDEKESDNIGISATANDDGIFCITIIGQIEGHYALQQGSKATKYEQILPLLVHAEQSESVKGLLVILNTVGGDVEAGLAIAELLSSMSKPTVSLVIGGGHSIGVPIAASCRRSFIVPSATMTIHPVRISGTGTGSLAIVRSPCANAKARYGFYCGAFIYRGGNVYEDDIEYRRYDERHRNGG